jgi:4-aminobutyrate aminotransferase-like enzyme
LLAGVQLSSSELAARVADELREAGVLVGRTGKAGDVLKIRPPLAFTDEHTEQLVRALDRALG